MEIPWSVLVLDDDPGVRQSLRLCLEADGAQVLTVGTAPGALDALDRRSFDVVFLDLWLQAESGLSVLPEILRRQPGVGVVVVTAYATFESAVEAMKLGATDYLPKPFTPEQVRAAAHRVVTTKSLKQQLGELEDRVGELEGEITFESRSTSFAAFLETARRAARSDAVILLRGESGTGKTVMARWIRQQSHRREGPFVTVHCPMLATDLISSILFGHQKGAFTGAVTDARGKVEEAEGGTLFLDEIADLSADAQARLLRFLNDRTYERVGEAQDRRADVRLVAASNRSLEKEVELGRLREDLFFRLNVITITVPTLRERPEDILPLAHHYLGYFERRQGRANMTLSAACEEAIRAYTWPGNIRELRNALERAVILAPSTVIEPLDLASHQTSRTALDAAAPRAPEIGGSISLEELEREHIARIVAQTSSFEAAARLLGIDVTTLQRKRKRYGLS